MKFAFSTVSCPQWDLPTVADKAKEYGYDGIELRGFLNQSILTTSNPFLTDPDKVRQTFADRGVSICCLASSVAFAQKRKADDQSAGELRQYIDLAGRLGCGLVKVFDMEVRPGQSRPTAGMALGDWLLPLGDYALSRDVTIVVKNALSFRSAKEIWAILERVGHPSIACCWDELSAAQIGEPPALSVPVLNSKIQFVQVKDARIGPLGVTHCKLGEGNVPIEKLVIRLRGIGYGGWVSYEWEKAWLPALAEPEEVLPHALGVLRKWKEGEAKPAKEAAKPKPHAAAKTA
jgi:fatty-acyl-CoA synthase